MTKPCPDLQREVAVIQRRLRQVFLGLPLILFLSPVIFCLAGECEREREDGDPFKTYRMEEIEYQRPVDHVSAQPSRTIVQFQSKENKVIDEFSKEDYYDIVDYYGGLDAEYSDIDYNEVRDYFED